jgi:hypothetical protein
MTAGRPADRETDIVQRGLFGVVYNLGVLSFALQAGEMRDLVASCA